MFIKQIEEQRKYGSGNQVMESIFIITGKGRKLDAEFNERVELIYCMC